MWNLTKFSYNGSVYGPLSKIKEKNPTLITLAGCREVCGTGNDYYEWKDSSATITTWVLPVIVSCYKLRMKAMNSGGL